MLYANVQQEEQQETARELADVLRLAQQMGQRLANETHGDLYYDVRAIIHDLQEVRGQLDGFTRKILPPGAPTLQAQSFYS
jgi:hypothetical protein